MSLSLKDWRSLLSFTIADYCTKKESKSVGRKEQRRQEAQRRKQLQPMKNKLNKKLEKQMAVLNKKKQKLEHELADVTLYEDKNKTRLKQCIVDKSHVDDELDTLEMEWLELGEAYEMALLED